MAGSNLIPFGMDGNGQWRIGITNSDVHNGLAVVGQSPTAPSVVIGAAAGSGASVSVAGSNIGGTVTFNSGTGILSSGAIFTVTFGGSFAFPANCAVSIDSANSAATSYPVYISSTTTTGFTVSWTSGTTLNTVLKYMYVVVGW